MDSFNEVNHSKLWSEKLHLLQKLTYVQTICHTLDLRLKKEVEEAEIPSENAEEFSLLLRNLLGVLDAHTRYEYYPKLMTLVNESQNEAEFWNLERRINETILVAAKLTPLIKFVYGARMEKNPWGVIEAVNRFCRKLYPRARVLVRPRWQYDYSYFPIAQELQKIAISAVRHDDSLYTALFNYIKEAPHFFSLAYPPTAATNLLQMAIWSHEIAHLVDHIEGLKIKNTKRPQTVDENLDDFISGIRASRDFSINLDRELLKALILRLGDEDAAIRVSEKLAIIIRNWAHEIFADIFAIQLFGPASILAAVEFLGPVYQGLDVITNPSYPSLRTRLDVLLDVYKHWLESHSSWKSSTHQKSSHILNLLEAEISHIKDHLQKPIKLSFSQEIPLEDQIIIKTFYPSISDYVQNMASVLFRDIDRVVKEHSDCFLKDRDIDYILIGVDELSSFLPPSFNLYSQSETFPSRHERILSYVINAGWLYWLLKRAEIESEFKGDGRELLYLHSDINKLLLKSIENHEAQRWFIERKLYGNKAELMEIKSDGFGLTFETSLGGVLTRKSLETLISNEELKIYPLLDRETQVGTCSIDVRLGNEFIVTRQPLITKIDPIDLDSGAQQSQFENKIYLPYGRPFVLHPGQFILASTLEYISVPENIMGLVINRASWGRLGLMIATTYKVIPGFKGCITLELTNLGNAPILLYPGMRIGQIVFYSIQAHNALTSKNQ